MPPWRQHRFLLLASLALSGCGGGTTDTPAVQAPVLTTVSVALGASTLQVGQSTQATAAGLDQNGATAATGAVTWSSSSSDVATVSSTGAITAVSPGQAQIIASAGDKSGHAPLTVVPAAAVVTTINVSLPASALEVASSMKAAATILDQNNATIAGKTVVWKSDSPGVASVSSDGVVTGVAAGTANIIATVDGKQGTAAATITTWTLDATVLSNADFGGLPGALADVSVLPLRDGRFRMIIGGFPTSPGGFGSAISTDGIKFTMESGVRLSTPVQIGGVGYTFVKPVAIRMDDGRIRLFASANTDATGGIYSFTSSDEGQTFSPDPGIRLTLAATGLGQLGTSSVVKVKGGGWRMYVNDNPPGTMGANGFIQLGAPKLLSAFSQDLTTWTMDPGVRIGAGATVSGDAQSAGSILNADGSTTIVYFRNTTGVTWQSTSADGLNFTSESRTGFGANDRIPIPAIDVYLLQLPSGAVRMYFNFGGNTAGAIYTAHHPGFSLK